MVGMLLTCVAFWCFIAACITGFACAGAGFGVFPYQSQFGHHHSRETGLLLQAKLSLTEFNH